MIIAQPDTIFSYLPLYIAREELGFELINCGNDDTAIRAVNEGRADLSVGDPMMFAEVDYGKTRVVSAFINRPLLHVITFDQFLDDMHGKVMVTYPQPSTSYMLSSELAKEYSLTLIETPFNTELGPLLTQEADVALILDPNFTQAVRNNARVLLDLTARPFAFTGFCTKGLVPKGFFTALRRAIKVFYEDDARTLAVAKKYFSLPDEVLKEAIEGMRKIAPYALEFSKAEIQEALRIRGLPYSKYAKHFVGIMKK